MNQHFFHTFKEKMFLKFLIALILLLDSANGFSWMMNNVLLSSSTLELNQADLALSKSVSAGAYEAIAECKHQFRYETWSCPEQAFFLEDRSIRSHDVGLLTNAYVTTTTTTTRNRDQVKVGIETDFSSVRLGNNRRERNSNSNVRKRIGRNRVAKVATESADAQVKVGNSPKKPLGGTKETAFVHAITAAGITHTLTKNCSTGDFPDCVCDHRLSKRSLGWEWGGCSDNYHFGSQVAKQFLDIVESGADSKSLANLHNNEAGRLAVRKTMRVLCKCHGVSGSCATRTCWKQISEFREVGNYLKNMYHKAMKVDFENGLLDHLDNSLGNRIGRTALNMEKKMRRKDHKMKKRKLVFIEESPDYCRKNSTTGYPGVVGRTCSAEPNNPKSKVKVETCTRLCEGCGLKARLKTSEVPTTCNCTFTWCCNVSCKTCITKRVDIVCMP